ncbi:glycerophosphodiester phosphodiesterase family protein [Mucilaginibacter sp. X4EP1]|uniref:glycerophosphodiester phosphodiesterase family protein n=1 Tax=Mucilaginibacter sp. X4EP1 TaxID=2723092 RepID=UPI00216AB121|nr:glycerophosphodiester phosphodiesterase family protein [Mucilaginibacter sp. X4EP1]MCS3812715.1 glycerophosphoryl diester phosphodiesterase [Mucilaginibacter sp. X4EP1]
MKHLTKIFTIGFLVSFRLTAFGQADQLIKQLHNPNDKHVMVVAHRGDWRNAPENSLQAYKLAIEMGVDVVETDLNETKDGVVIVMHDETIDRTTDGKGKPSDYTLAELKKFHLRNGLGVVTKHTIPTLEELMELAKGKILVNLDKSYPYYREAYAVLKKTGTLQQAIFKTTVPYQEVRAKYGALLDSITFMPVVNIDKPAARTVIDEYQHEIKPVAFELNFPTDTSKIIENAGFIRENHSKIWINALWPWLNGGHDDDRAVEENDKKDSWDWLIARGATMIQTDRPKDLLNYLRSKSLHK